MTSSDRDKQFVFSKSFRPALRPAQSAMQWVHTALSPGVGLSEREAQHLLPSNVEMKNECLGVALLPAYTFVAWGLMKHRVYFTWTAL